MEKKGYEDQAVTIVQALAQVQKQEDAIGHLRRYKDEFSGENKKGHKQACELSELRVRVWKRNPEATIRSINHRHVTFEGITLRRVPCPPPGYAYKGGAARLALLELLGESVGVRTPRDLDLVRIGKHEREVDQLVAEEFMEEDFKRGHGVEVIESIDTYMNSRDLTINEILYFSDRIICSLQGIQDTLSGKLRFTRWCLRENGKPESRVYVKALRFHAESMMDGREYDLSLLGKPEKTALFDIALHLDRALIRGTKAAELFCQNCCSSGLLPGKFRHASVGDVGAYLIKKDSSLKKTFPSLLPVKSKFKRPII